MRIPVKSERDAFRIAFGSAAAIAAAVILGALTKPGFGVVLFAGMMLGALAWEVLSVDPDRPQPLRDAARAAPASDGRPRVLVIANETVAGQELRDVILEHAPRGPEVRVVCPILPSRAHYITSDIDRELAEARVRLERTLAWAAQHGIRASGHVSDDTPLRAAADELRRFPADEIIVSTHPPDRSRWLESGLVERLRRELDIPVHHVVVDLRRLEQPAAAASDR
jgi:hypothetical protein